MPDKEPLWRRVISNTHGMADERALPLVSIVVTAFNYERFVEACLASVSEQTYSRLECVVVDDCSTDKTAEAVERVIDRKADQRFSFIRNETNLGQLATQSVGFGNCRGSFVVFLDADDLLAPNFAERHVFAHLNTAYPSGLSASDQITVDEEGVMHSGTRFDRRSLSGIKTGRTFKMSGEQAASLDVVFLPWYDRATQSPSSWWWMSQSGMMFRRTVLDLIVPDRQECGQFRICADYFLARFAHLVANSMLLLEPLGGYRQHGHNGFAGTGYLSVDQQNGDMRRHPGYRAFAELALATMEKRREQFEVMLGNERVLAIRAAITRGLLSPGYRSFFSFLPRILGR